MTKKTLYFLCTGNACRSQMAEGLAKKYLSHNWEVRSAGIEAHVLNPQAVKAMKKIGIDISNQKSEIINQDYLNQATIAVTLCEDAKIHCPMFPPHVKGLHWRFEDPAKLFEQKLKSGKRLNVCERKLVHELRDLKK